jgi:hypothetical protein
LHPNLCASLDVELLGVFSLQVGHPANAKQPKILCDAFSHTWYYLQLRGDLLP